MKEKREKSKLRNLTYNKLEIQKYLTTDLLNTQEKRLIYRIRTQMVNTPACYGQNTLCSLCNLARDEMSHVIQCVVIKLACPEVYLNGSVKVEDAYEGSDMEKIKKLAVVYTKAWSEKKMA